MQDPTCSVCGKSGQLKRGMCGTDYAAWRKALVKAGRPLPPKPPRTRATPAPTCRVCGRDGKIKRQLCVACYARWRRGLDPAAPTERDRASEDRFLTRIDKNGPVPAHRPELGACWLFTGKPGARDYGKFYANGKLGEAHRFSYELFVKPIPDGLDLDHVCHPGDGSCPWATCTHHGCVNPAHLEPVTHAENMRRGNTFAAANLAKTHCPQGHEYTAENTRVKTGPTGRPQRECRQCRRGDVNAPGA